VASCLDELDQMLTGFRAEFGLTEANSIEANMQCRFTDFFPRVGQPTYARRSSRRRS
jgi:hypothetical protein